MSIVSLALFGAALIPSQDLLIFGVTIRPGVHGSVDGRFVALGEVRGLRQQG